MNGYGSHTYSLWNNGSKRYWVKFHFKTRQGHKHYTNEEAREVVGKSREPGKKKNNMLNCSELH